MERNGTLFALLAFVCAASAAGLATDAQDRIDLRDGNVRQRDAIYDRFAAAAKDRRYADVAEGARAFAAAPDPFEAGDPRSAQVARIGLEALRQKATLAAFDADDAALEQTLKQIASWK